MNAEQFYNEFKFSLQYLGLKWGEMDKANVKIQGDQIVMEYGNRKTAFKEEDK